MFELFILIYCGLVTSYGDRNLGQHWLGTKPLPEPNLTNMGIFIVEMSLKFTNLSV